MASSSPDDREFRVARERACAADRPTSARFEPAWKLRGVNTDSLAFHLLVSLDGPGPSGSTSPSRRCRGCSYPRLRLQVRAASSFTGLLRQTRGADLSSALGCIAPRGALIDLHTAAGRSTRALDAARELFARAPSLGAYRRLRACAESCDVWPYERDPALAGLRDAIDRQRRQTATSRSPWQRHDGSTLVEILLSEDDVDAAWKTAETYGCRADLELQLAKRRADERPSDALAVYRRHLDRALEPAKDHAYAEVVRLLTLMRPLHQRLGQDAAFDRLVTEIRTGYKRRRNLIKRLDRARL